jgi:hypothetical protein
MRDHDPAHIVAKDVAFTADESAVGTAEIGEGLGASDCATARSARVFTCSAVRGAAGAALVTAGVSATAERLAAENSAMPGNVANRNLTTPQHDQRERVMAG